MSPESGSSDSDTDDRVLKTSKLTVADYFSYCREICVWAVETKIQKRNIIGGAAMQETLTQWRFNVGPTSATLGQRLELVLEMTRVNLANENTAEVD